MSLNRNLNDSVIAVNYAMRYLFTCSVNFIGPVLPEQHTLYIIYSTTYTFYALFTPS